MNKPYYESLHDTHTVTTARFFFFFLSELLI